MPEPARCKGCGALIPDDAPEGVCPKCALEGALGEPPGSESSARAMAEEEREFRAAQLHELSGAFPDYELLELLGRGGMGEVYKARQKKLDRIVAIKILPEPFGKVGEFTERFLREARSLARLSHPNIVTIFDYGESNGVCYFVMEYVDGVDLRRMIQARTLAPEEALRIVPQICDALQFAHDQEIVHRDIKPANILVDKRGRVKIADFGLAKIVKREPDDLTLTVTGGVMGTPEYMAPEQRRASQQVDHRADIYSLGVVFYEMLTGEIPMGKFDPPSKLVHLDVRLDEVVLRTLEREPDRRYQHVSEVKTGVETIVRNPETAAGVGGFNPESGITPKERAREPVISTPPARKTEEPHPVPFTKFVGPAIVFLFVAAAVIFRGPFSLLAFPLPPLLMAAVVSIWMILRDRKAPRNVKYREMPPEIRRRGWWQVGGLIAGLIVATVVVVSLIPTIFNERNEVTFAPQSADFKDLVIAGSFKSYFSIFGTLHAAPKKWGVEMTVRGNDGNAHTMHIDLPNLRVEMTMPSFHGGVTRAVLDLETLTNWLRDEVKIDMATPKSQAEAKEIMQVLKRYEIVPPQTWNEFFNFATATLTDFNMHGFKSNGSIGASDLNVVTMLLFAAYLLVLFRIKDRLQAAARAEIDAGRWTPPATAK